MSTRMRLAWLVAIIAGLGLIGARVATAAPPAGPPPPPATGKAPASPAVNCSQLDRATLAQMRNLRADWLLVQCGWAQGGTAAPAAPAAQPAAPRNPLAYGGGDVD